MKVIDIMQKVANKEIFRFRIDDVNYYVDKSNYICKEDGDKVEWYIDDEWLNMNAEIIEEDKKIKKINIYDKSIGIKGTTFFREKDIEIFQKLSMVINEIIDYLEEKE